MIHFVGAGCGAPDLITVRAQALLRRADVIIYAGSLVNPELLKERKPGCAVYNSAHMTLEQILAVMLLAEERGQTTVRLHSGDPCLYGAIREQMDELERHGVEYDCCPGVSSFCGAAAALHLEYTLPGLSQSVIITRAAGRTAVPERESIAALSAHGATMVVFLSANLTDEVARQAMAGGYAPDTPAAIVYKASWPDQQIFLCTVATLSQSAREHGIFQTALILIGPAVGHRGYERSRLYHPNFATGCRPADEARP